ncbi:ASCH domain-containing protein [Anaerostipes hadrus]|uniref:ASCH domain-containing protein n=1 Tax=Anaerostipes hadrus TaxID=649756 RepID=UPI0032C15713
MSRQEKIKNAESTSWLTEGLSKEKVISIVGSARKSVNAKTALFSIRPEYVEKIFNGTKKFEYRKQPNRIPISKILIYETAPIMKIVGEAEVEKVLVDTPEVIWEKTKEYPGINKKFYDQYFRKRDTAVAYQLKNVIKFDIPKELSDFGIKRAPQSFCYLP